MLGAPSVQFLSTYPATPEVRSTTRNATTLRITAGSYGYTKTALLPDSWPKPLNIVGKVGDKFFVDVSANFLDLCWGYTTDSSEYIIDPVTGVLEGLFTRNVQVNVSAMCANYMQPLASAITISVSDSSMETLTLPLGKTVTIPLTKLGRSYFGPSQGSLVLANMPISGISSDGIFGTVMGTESTVSGIATLGSRTQAFSCILMPLTVAAPEEIPTLTARITTKRKIASKTWLLSVVLSTQPPTLIAPYKTSGNPGLYVSGQTIHGLIPMVLSIVSFDTSSPPLVADQTQKLLFPAIAPGVPKIAINVTIQCTVNEDPLLFLISLDLRGLRLL